MGRQEPALCLVLWHGWDCLCHQCMAVLVSGGLCHQCTKCQAHPCEEDLLLTQGCLWPLLIFTLMVSGCSPQGSCRIFSIGKRKCGFLPLCLFPPRYPG